MGKRKGRTSPNTGSDEYPMILQGFGWLKADVPGDVHSTLLKHGLIPDPYRSDNYRHTQWAQRV